MAEDDFTLLNTDQIDTEVLSIHNNSNQTIGSFFQTINFQVQNIVDTSYSHKPGSGLVKILKDGRYVIRADITIVKTVGNQRSHSEFALWMNRFMVAGTKRLIYNQQPSQPGTSASIQRTLDLQEGDVVEIRARRASGSGRVAVLSQASILEIHNIL